MAKIDGPGLAAVSVGLVFIYGGVKGYSPIKAFENIITGKNPNENQSNTSLVNSSGSNGSSSGGDVANPTSNTSAANQATAKQLATNMGHSDWTTGQEWSDWVALWNQESGWSITAANPSSSARGIAQNLQGYGPDYLEGNAVSQITWGINYIAQRYGNPSVAEAHEKANNWY
ncbi:MAG TPA: hypothetical protein VII99_06125 [Bacteroidia bacterium]